MPSEKYQKIKHRLERFHSPSARSWHEDNFQESRNLPSEQFIDCGWGRLIFAHTYSDPARLAETLRHEKPGTRDIALYVPDPHVVIAKAPQEIFLDPSDTYRLWLAQYRPPKKHPKSFIIRRLRSFADAEEITRICITCHMVPADPQFIWDKRGSKSLTYAVAEDAETGEIIGTATGVDHKNTFDDPENGSSLWCLAVDPQAKHPGLGLALVNFLASHFQARGRDFMDISVLHDNTEAISLYRKMGFQRIPAFSVKRKNPINEPLFIGPQLSEDLNSYSMLIINEARRRGIGVEVIDAENNYFSLSYGGRSIVCRESLTELTSAIAMSRCDDKEVTTKLLKQAGLQVPNQIIAENPDTIRSFFDKHKTVVVKPAQGEQGRGVHVRLSEFAEVKKAVEKCRKQDIKIILEEFFDGMDLRIVVINYAVVAAAIRKPAQIVGTGQHTIRDLIKKQSRRRAAATDGESRIPLDGETKRCVIEAGYTLDDILPAKHALAVRNTANLHTGGTIHDVTAKLHPDLAAAAKKAAAIIDIPVVGIDFIVKSHEQGEYVFIEANERPGLANHEPQPTAERFIDFLFPDTIRG
jgi:GNAT-family acetyltransferase (TIGR03103 family)